MNVSSRSDRNRYDPSFEDARLGALDGRSESFEWFFHRYAGRIRGFAIARGTDDAEAVANDVMLRSFQRLGSFSGDEAAFLRWLYTIARNRLIDGHRRAQRRPEIPAEIVPDQPVESAEVGALTRLSAEDVHERLSVLTAEQREVIALRLIEDLSLNDVAEIVGRPVTAVKALQRRGLNTLRRQLATDGNEA